MAAAEAVMASPATSAAPPARRPLAELDRDELLVKCKGLLQIAQKAKAAKDGETRGSSFWPLFEFGFCSLLLRALLPPSLSSPLHSPAMILTLVYFVRCEC